MRNKNVLKIVGSQIAGGREGSIKMKMRKDYIFIYNNFFGSKHQTF